MIPWSVGHHECEEPPPNCEEGTNVSGAGRPGTARGSAMIAEDCQAERRAAPPNRESGWCGVSLTSVVIFEAWAKLGADARGYQPMTRGGMPTDRLKRTLFTRIFDKVTKSELQRPEISDPVAAAVEQQVHSARERLDRTAGWHKALRDAYYRLPKDDRFLPDAVEGLFVAAWDEAEHPGEPVAESADAVIARLLLQTGDFSAFQLDRLLVDSEVRAELERIVDGAWEDVGTPPEVLGDADAREVRRELEDLCRDLVPERGRFSSQLADAWLRISQDPRIPQWTDASRLRLTLDSAPSRPALDGRSQLDEEQLHWTLAAIPYRPLDDTLRGRLGKVLKSPPFAFDLTPTAWDGLERAALVSAQAFSLGSAPARAALVVGAYAYMGVAVDRYGRTGALPRGAIAYLAKCWRSSAAVSAQLSRSGAAGFADAQDYVEDPYEYLIGRLWVRLSRTDYDGHTLSTPSELWWHLTEALRSSANHVSELAMRIAREGLGFAYVDADEKTAQGLEDERKPTTGRMDEPRDGLAVVLRHGMERAGIERVDGVVASMAGLNVETPEQSALADVWESWVLGAAANRVAQRESREGPFDAEHSSAVQAEEIARLPAYAQAREHVRARRVAACIRALRAAERERHEPTREETR